MLGYEHIWPNIFEKDESRSRFREESTVQPTASDFHRHSMERPTKPEARDPDPTMDLNNRSRRYNTGGTFLLNGFNSIGQSLGSFRLRIGDARCQVISEFMDQPMSNSPTLEKHHVLMEVWLDTIGVEMLLAGNKRDTEVDAHHRYFRNSLKKLARLWKVLTGVTPRDLPHVTLLLGNSMFGKYLSMGNVPDINPRRIRLSAGTMAEESEKPNIKRTTLEKHNMTQHDIGEVELPSNVQAVREGLVEFSIALAQASTASTAQFLQTNEFKKDSLDEIPQSMFIRRSLSEDERKTMTREPYTAGRAFQFPLALDFRPNHYFRKRFS